MRTIAYECTLHFIVLGHFYVHVCYIHFVKNRRERNLDYRCVYAVKLVICVKGGLDWRNLRFKMERIRKKGKQHDNADVTFRIVPTTDEIGRLVVTYQSQFVANSYLLLWVIPQSTYNCSRKWKNMCYQTLTDINTRSTSTWVGHCSCFV